MMCDKNKAQDILKSVYHNCQPLFAEKLQDAYLYGSYARGDQHEQSDVDILLTADLSSAEIAELRRGVAAVSSALSLENDVTVSVTVKPAAQFEMYRHALPYYVNVIREGIRYAG